MAFIPINTHIRDLCNRLYRLHEQAQDAHLELWPGDELFAVLEYTKKRHHALPASSMSSLRREQILLRMELVTLASTKLDLEQLELLDQARPNDARPGQHPVELKELAKAMGLTSPSGVSQRHKRLIAAAHNRPRTPQGGKEVLEEMDARARKEFLALQAAQTHHSDVLKAARDLLKVQDQLKLTEDAADWVEDLEQMAVESLRPKQMSGLAALLSRVVSGVMQEEETTPCVRQILKSARAALSYRN